MSRKPDRRAISVYACLAVPLSTVHRPRWRSYLLLSRVSNLPTIWTNVLAGISASSGSLEWPTYVRVAAAVSLFYTGGMFLNDAFDERFDCRARPERPIPCGDVSRREVFVIGGALLGLGELLLAPTSVAAAIRRRARAAIVLYDHRHKGNSWRRSSWAPAEGLSTASRRRVAVRSDGPPWSREQS